jgi:hypothetical protein
MFHLSIFSISLLTWCLRLYHDIASSNNNGNGNKQTATSTQSGINRGDDMINAEGVRDIPESLDHSLVLTYLRLVFGVVIVVIAHVLYIAHISVLYNIKLSVILCCNIYYL